MMDIYIRTFEQSVYTVLEAIQESRFVCINLKLTGSPPAIPQVIPAIDYQKPTLQQRYEEVKKAAEHYQVVQFGLTCAKEDLHQKRYALSTFNFNLQPVPDRTLHIERQIHVDTSSFNASTLDNHSLDQCFAKGIPYCSREEEDHSRTIEYGDEPHGESDPKVLQRDSLLGFRHDLINGLDDFFYITNSVRFPAQIASATDLSCSTMESRDQELGRLRALMQSVLCR